jgi:hypothetical protein
MREIDGDTVADVQQTHDEIIADEKDPRRNNILEVLERIFGEELVTLWLLENAERV